MKRESLNNKTLQKTAQKMLQTWYNRNTRSYSDDLSLYLEKWKALSTMSDYEISLYLCVCQKLFGVASLFDSKQQAVIEDKNSEKGLFISLSDLDECNHNEYSLCDLKYRQKVLQGALLDVMNLDAYRKSDLSGLPQYKTLLFSNSEKELLRYFHTESYIDQLQGVANVFESCKSFVKIPIDVYQETFLTAQTFYDIKRNLYMLEQLDNALQKFHNKEKKIQFLNAHLRYYLTRPSGHHAEPDNGQGFCPISTVGILANLLAKKHKLRALVIDIDIHGGNWATRNDNESIRILDITTRETYPYNSMDLEGYVFVKQLMYRQVLQNNQTQHEIHFLEPQLKLPTLHQELSYLVQSFMKKHHSQVDVCLLSAGFDMGGQDASTKNRDGRQHANGNTFCHIGKLLKKTLIHPDTKQKIPLIMLQEGGYDEKNLGQYLKKLLNGYLDFGSENLRRKRDDLKIVDSLTEESTQVETDDDLIFSVQDALYEKCVKLSKVAFEEKKRLFYTYFDPKKKVLNTSLKIGDVVVFYDNPEELGWDGFFEIIDIDASDQHHFKLFGTDYKEPTPFPQDEFLDSIRYVYRKSRKY